MSSPQATSLTERLAALAARSGGPQAPTSAPDIDLNDRLGELVDLTGGLRADVGSLHASGDVQSSALGQLEQRITTIESRLDGLEETVRAESARLEAALGQRVEEAALALAETLLGGASESS